VSGRTPGSLLFAALLLGAAAAFAQSPAQHYPDRPIRLLVPNAPGSSIDTLSRIVAVKLGETLGQQIVVDNRAGAGGILGMELAKNASPDGYTLISATTAASTIALLLHKNPGYHPVRDYDYIGQFAATPNVLVVNPALPVASLKELIDYAKARPGQVNMASAGAGSQSHLAGAYLMAVAHMPSLHVPYKGGGASVAAVMAGESHWTLTPAPAVMSLVRGGRLRALAHSLPRRSALLGDIPPIAETVPGFDYSGWQGLLAPKGTSPAVLAKVHAALARTMNLPEVKEAFAAQATEVVLGTAQEFRKLVQESLEANAKVVATIGLKAE